MRKRYTLRSHRGLNSMTRRHMFAGLRKPYMDSKLHPGLGTPGSTHICRTWASLRVRTNPNLYFLLVGSEMLILVLYVDDLILTGAESLIAGCKSNLASEFELKNIGSMHYFLGLEVWQRSGEIFLAQGKYVLEILKRFRMQDSRPMATPMVTNLKKIDSSISELADLRLYRQLIGSLMYMVNTWFVNVFGQYSTRHLLCCQQPEPVHGGSEGGSLGGSKAHAQICARHSGIWFVLPWWR
jgi:hypothetical protein